MLNIYLVYYTFLFAFLCFSVVFANEKEANTTDASGGGQVVASPVDVLVLDEGGNPVEVKEMQIVPQDRAKISIESDSLITNRSGHINFFILVKR